MTEMTEPRWKRRFRAPSLTLPHWAVGDPERLVYASNRSGSWQVHAWDRRDGSQRQGTDHPTGVVMGAPTPDGQGVLWFDDSKGDEIGVWRLQPFHGGEVAPLAPDVEPAWSAGLALAADGRLALGTADRTGFSVRVGRIGAPTTELYRHEQTVDVADVSRDGHLLVVHHAEHGDNLHPALRAFDLDRGEAIGDLWDGKGYGLMASRFSPVPGDWRLALLHECGGLLRPALWNPVAGERTDLEMDLPGQVEVADWWPDGGALLLVHTHAGRDELYRLDLRGGRSTGSDRPTARRCGQTATSGSAGPRAPPPPRCAPSAGPSRCCARRASRPRAGSPNRAGPSPTSTATRSTASSRCRAGRGPTRPSCWCTAGRPTTTPMPGARRSRRWSTTAGRSRWSTTGAPPAMARRGRTRSRATG